MNDELDKKLQEIDDFYGNIKKKINIVLVTIFCTFCVVSGIIMYFSGKAINVNSYFILMTISIAVYVILVLVEKLFLRKFQKEIESYLEMKRGEEEDVKRW